MTTIITIINIKNIKTVSITTWSFRVCCIVGTTTTEQVYFSVPLTPSTTRFRQNRCAPPGGNSRTLLLLFL